MAAEWCGLILPVGDLAACYLCACLSVDVIESVRDAARWVRVKGYGTSL